MDVEPIVVKIEADVSEFKAAISNLFDEIEARLSAIERRQENLAARMAKVQSHQL